MKLFGIELAYAALAVAGGAANYAMTYMKNKKFSIGMCCAQLVISGFSGYMFFLAIQITGANEGITAVSAGIGGFLGTNALEFLAKQIQGKLSL